jgi:phage protein U
VAELNRQHRDSEPDDRPVSVRYAASGHPSVEQLMAEQGTGPVNDVSVLHGDFWPEEESIEEFLEALHEWRGHTRTDPAA